MRTIKNIYRTYIDVIGYVKSDSKRFDTDADEQAKKDKQDADMEMIDDQANAVDGE